MKAHMIAIIFALILGFGCVNQQNNPQNVTNFTPPAQPINTPVTNHTSVNESTANKSVQTMLKITQNSKYGEILSDGNGMTLYTFNNDQINKSNCNDGCAANWPPLIITDEHIITINLPGSIGAFRRDDGSIGATYNGMPLYYWAGDRNPGDSNGQGIGGMWFVVETNSTQRLMNAEQATEIAENSSSCQSAGNLTGTAQYNSSSRTWWIDINGSRTGCSASCIVYESNLSTQVDLRCAGTIQPISVKPEVALYQSRTFGQILTDGNGMTLYVFRNDATGPISCGGYCPTWKPLIHKSGQVMNTTTIPGVLDTASRTDRTLQITYNGMPLYTYSYDNSPGEVSGDGINNAWYAAKTNLTTYPSLPVPQTYYGGGGGGGGY